MAPFENSFTGGAFVAAGNVNGDGFADIAVSADTSGGARVIVYSGKNGSVFAALFGIDAPGFRGGARVALGDVNDDGLADPVVAAGTGGGPRIAVFDGASLRPGLSPTRFVADFYAFESTSRVVPTFRPAASTAMGKRTSSSAAVHTASPRFDLGRGYPARVRTGRSSGNRRPLR